MNEADRSDIKIFGWMLWGGFTVFIIIGRKFDLFNHPAYLVSAVAYLSMVIVLVVKRVGGTADMTEVKAGLLFHPAVLVLIGVGYFLK